ncbi:T9SS type A sorting domain-containing protein, partial [Candidatus Poribacteria bacterium]|nr:T9SS type A sorting domain-containing protein [Candidatus Poribacteria bacterium]
NVGNLTEYAWSFVVEEEVALSHPPRIAPNPFADDVDVMLFLGQEAEVQVRVYDATQRLVATVPSVSLLPGRQRISLADAFAPFGRGIYLVQIIVEAGDSQRVSKVLKAAKAR